VARRPNRADRGYIEGNSIALTSRLAQGLDPSSAKWLGRPADRTEFSTSGLWNVDHVHRCDTGFLDLLDQLIQRQQWALHPARRAAEARIVRSLLMRAAPRGRALQRSGPGRRLSEVPGSGLAEGEHFLALVSPQAGCGPPVLAEPRLATLGRRVS
jgi:hypothetical protein